MTNVSALRLHGAGLVIAIAAPLAWAQAGHHVMADPSRLDGAAVQLAIIEGPMNEAVPFTVGLKFPANYRIPPHWHPVVEQATVLAGTVYMGAGEEFDSGSTHVHDWRLAIMPVKSPHAWISSEMIVQLHGTRP